jgi:hypothetical protein
MERLDELFLRVGSRSTPGKRFIPRSYIWGDRHVRNRGAFVHLPMLRHIRQTEERYKHLLDTANDAILVLDAENKAYRASQPTK